MVNGVEYSSASPRGIPTMKKMPQLVKVLLAVSSSLLLAIVVHAEATGNPVGKTLIGEDSVYFSWGAMILLASILVTSVTAMVQARNHMANTDIHPSSGALMKDFARKEDCVLKHTEVRGDFTRIHERLDKMQDDVSYIRGKFESNDK